MAQDLCQKYNVYHTLAKSIMCIYLLHSLGIYLHPLGIPLIFALLSVPSPLGVYASTLSMYIPPHWVQYLQFGHVTPRYGSRGGGAGHVPFPSHSRIYERYNITCTSPDWCVVCPVHTTHQSSGTHNTSDRDIQHTSPVHTIHQQSKAFNTPSSTYTHQSSTFNAPVQYIQPVIAAASNIRYGHVDGWPDFVPTVTITIKG